MSPQHFLYFFLSLFFVSSCNTRDEKKTPLEPTLFQLREASHTGITFSNDLTYTEEINTYTFRNFYNGGGVGLADFNNDGLVDIFFSGSMVSNRLYLNKGNFQFEDITEAAGLGSLGIWTTGVAIVDINGDGLLDIYLCKSGTPGGIRRHNELFVNRGNLTFSEESAAYGLAFEGLSTHAAFFDFDRDGDLDCYLLNNSFRPVGGNDLRKDQRLVPDPEGGSKLLMNNNGKFVDISAQAGIYTSEIGFGLGVTLGDVNKDGWPDIYVSNDFFERDYLYINKTDGTFTESLELYLREISMGSMGADMADVNNDGYPDIFVTEMLPEDDARLKTSAQFENWDRYRLSVNAGYYHQFARNVLQLNRGDGSFSEISRLAGVHATDWSWGALIFDIDNDGWKDIFVANGIYKDLLNQDYINFTANPDMIRQMIRAKQQVITQLIDSIPSHPLSNYAFHNEGNLAFSNKTDNWGLGMPSHSNGSAYGDLDNDGDLDLVLNNLNSVASIYENRAVQVNVKNTFLSFILQGQAGNPFSVGAKVTIYDKGEIFYQELFPARGFMSTVDHRLHFGLGNSSEVDSVVIDWPDGRITKLSKVAVNQQVMLNSEDAAPPPKAMDKKSEMLPVFSIAKTPQGLIYQHVEDDFVDFDRDRLLFNMISNEGPCLCKGDINRDGLDDFYIGGAKNQPGSLFIQSKGGGFSKSNDALFALDKLSEDTGCVFFDANGDGWDDLYVTSGSNQFSNSSPALLDRLYFNEGQGKLIKSLQPLPSARQFESTSCVVASDYDGDGDMDLFVGARLVPLYYGLPANGYILSNDGKGNFIDETEKVAPGLRKLGLITDAQWTDINNDNKPDLIVVGEWMPVKVFINELNVLTDRTAEYGLMETNGWYNTLATGDFNGDGKIDFVAGNHGLNSRFRASRQEPVSLYVNDFDQNGSVEHILTRYYAGVAYPLVLRQDLIMQLPYLKKKYLRFKDYQSQTISDIFVPEQLEESIILNAYTLETRVWINAGGKFEHHALPVEAQFSPVYAVLVQDFNGDGNLDILLGGNLYRAKPETGIYDASRGLLLFGGGDGSFESVSSKNSGINIKGEIRAFSAIKHREGKVIVIGKNNGLIELLKY